MITKVTGEKPFQVMAETFCISPSNEGYTLQFSADGTSFTDLMTVDAGGNKTVTEQAVGTYYRLIGNATEVTVTSGMDCNTGGGGGSYTLPTASSTTLGGVKIGDGISIDSDGKISASGGGNNNLKTEMGWDSDNSVWKFDSEVNKWTTEQMLYYLAGNASYEDKASRTVLKLDLKNGNNEVCAVAYPTFEFPNGHFSYVQPSSELYFTFIAPESPTSNVMVLWKYKFVPNYYYYDEKPTITFVSKTTIGGGSSTYTYNISTLITQGSDAIIAFYADVTAKVTAGDISNFKFIWEDSSNDNYFYSEQACYRWQKSDNCFVVSFSVQDAPSKFRYVRLHSTGIYQNEVG